jgi:hypothetical protein
MKCNTTAIIPVKIDSEQRKKNINNTLRYLLKNTNFNIIVTECDLTPKLDISPFDSKRLIYKFETIVDNNFHRTRLINQMLDMVTTPVTANYDADVFLDPTTYTTAEKLIITKQADVIYPYGYNAITQRRIYPDTKGLDIFEESLNLNDLKLDSRSPWLCRYGHVQFFNTDCYRKGFMENENYVHWCPEDHERGVRFQKLGYKVNWINTLVYHQEHPPAQQSFPTNIVELETLHSYLTECSPDELKKYYESQGYLKKYKNA